MTTEMRGVHSIMASASAMLKRDEDIFLVPKQFGSAKTVMLNSFYLGDALDRQTQ